MEKLKYITDAHLNNIIRFLKKDHNGIIPKDNGEPYREEYLRRKNKN